MKHARRLARVLLSAVAIAALLALGAHFYLSSRQGAALIAFRLAASVGGSVEVGSADIGILGSSLRDLRLFAAGSSEPWLEIGSVQANVFLGSLLKGTATPRWLVLTDATVILRLDRAGNLLSQMPTGAAGDDDGGQLALTVSQGKLRVLQARRPEFMVGGIQLDLSRTGNRWAIHGPRPIETGANGR